MPIAILLLMAGFASAQKNEDARALLDDIVSSSRAAKSWIAEATQVTEMTVQGTRVHGETHFKVAYQRPSKMLLELDGKGSIGGIETPPTGTLKVCDGIDHWTHFKHSTGFFRAPVGVSPCRPSFGDFSSITQNLRAANLVGHDLVQFSGAARECLLVRVEYQTAGSSRTLCIDARERLVLRDREVNESIHLDQTTTYSRFSRDSDLPDSLFQFTVPTGFIQDDGPERNLIVEDGVYRPSMSVSYPTLVSMVEPSYNAEERESGLSGIVLVSLQVSADGHPQKVKVVRGLVHRLDEKAVDAVGQWRFNPGSKDGLPVAVGPITVTVNFP